MSDPLATLAAAPAVADAVASARTACEALRWHEGFRRRWREVRAETGLRAAAASAALDGAPVGVDVLRAWATGGGAPGTGADVVA
ncbi:cell filamentation protein Fic, partial [Cellulomonas shaoxiangyii]